MAIHSASVVDLPSLSTILLSLKFYLCILCLLPRPFYMHSSFFFVRPATCFYTTHFSSSYIVQGFLVAFFHYIYSTFYLLPTCILSICTSYDSYNSYNSPPARPPHDYMLPQHGFTFLQPALTRPPRTTPKTAFVISLTYRMHFQDLARLRTRLYNTRIKILNIFYL